MARLSALVAIVGFLAMSTGVASAQIEQGDSEILANLAAIGFFVDDANLGFVVGVGQYGYYFRQNQQITVGGSVVSIFGAGDELDSADASATTLGLIGGYRYYFDVGSDSPVAPYVGGGVNIFDVSNFTGTAILQGRAGFKYYLTRNVAFDINGTFGTAFSDFGAFITTATFGITYVFPAG